MYQTNAKIIRSFLGVEDHGIFTCMLTLEGDGWGIGYGGYSMDTWHAELNRRVGTAYGMEVIMQLLNALELECWEDLKGKCVRVEMDHEFGKVVRIGHLLKNKWFSFDQVKGIGK